MPASTRSSCRSDYPMWTPRSWCASATTASSSPGRRDRTPKTLWLWWTGPPASTADLDRIWRAYIRRFDIEHTIRFAKQTLGATTPKIRTPAQADRLLTVADLADDAVVRIADERGAERPRPLVAGGALAGLVP